MADLRAGAGRLGGAAGSYGLWLSAARAKLERALGLEVWHVPTSLLCDCEAWLVFVGEWMRHAEVWTDCYNRHLAAYRQRMGIVTSHHPMPDLQRAGDVVELPFWIYRQGEARERLFIRRAGAGILVRFGGREIDVTNGLAPLLGGSVGPLQIRPRALTLTMYVRMFVADVFIHGIGGALYDRITDGIMEELWGVAPPYGCVSAAWLLPLGTAAAGGDSVPALRRRRHHLVHNPQSAVEPAFAGAEVAALLRRREELVAGLAASLRSAEGR